MRSLFLMLLSILLLIACSPSYSSKNDNSGSANENPLDNSPPENIVDDGVHKPKKILILGDSLSSRTGFAFDMVDFFEKLEVNCGELSVQTSNFVKFYARPSASPRHFVDSLGANKDWICKQKIIYLNGTGPNISGRQLCKKTSDLSVLEKLLVDQKPDVVIFILGTNSIGFSTTYLEAKVNKALDQIGTSQCIWIGPTMVSSKYEARVLKTEKALEKILEKHQKNCLFIKTFDEIKKQTECKSFNVSDGLHHSSCGSHLWAKTVMNKICLE